MSLLRVLLRCGKLLYIDVHRNDDDDYGDDDDDDGYDDDGDDNDYNDDDDNVS